MKVQKRDGGSITVGQWEPYDWDFGEKPIECHRIKVGRGYIYLHLRPKYTYTDGEARPTGINTWQICCDFGADSDDSYSSCIPEPCGLDEAKAIVFRKYVTKVGC